jgi:hypothetical protein
MASASNQQCPTPSNRRGQVSRGYTSTEDSPGINNNIKQKQLGITFTKMYWILGCNSKLSTNNKLLIYKTILKLIWTYRIQLWGTTPTSKIEILERFQSKALHLRMDTLWCVPNTVMWRMSTFHQLNTKSAVTGTITVSATVCTQIN